MAAKYNPNQGLKMPRACPVEFHVCLLFSQEREPPRLKAVASGFSAHRVEGSDHRETPGDKPVAS